MGKITRRLSIELSEDPQHYCEPAGTTWEGAAKGDEEVGQWAERLMTWLSAQPTKWLTSSKGKGQL